MGTPDFAVKSLKALVEAKHKLLAVVTVPDKIQGRGLKLKPSPVKVFAEEHNIPVLQPADLKDTGFIESLAAFDADIFVVVAFRILPQAVFSLPKLGTVNVHASLLPFYRGAAPINWAIINGDNVSGVTTMFIDARVDTGDILLQSETEITQEMNAGQLHDILAEKGADLLIKTLVKIEKNDIVPLIQDNSKATRAPKLTNDNCLLDFDKPAKDVYNLIRGLSPYPAAFTYISGKKVKIFRAFAEDNTHKYPPGTIINVKSDSFAICCREGAVVILELQIEGRKRMATRDFLNGYDLKDGDSAGL